MRVEPPDLELWVTGYVREQAANSDMSLDVSNKEPSDLALPMRRPLVIIRDDSGSRLDWTTFDRSIGASVLGGSKRDDKPANDLGRWLAALLFDDAIVLVPGSPIAAVTWSGCNGPYPVDEQLDVARRYLTAQYTVTGSW